LNFNQGIFTGRFLVMTKEIVAERNVKILDRNHLMSNGFLSIRSSLSEASGFSRSSGRFEERALIFI
jgi:hypothetical protein